MKTLISLILLLSTLPASAQPAEKQREAMHALFSGNLARADSLIDAGISAASDRPDFYFLKAHHAFYSRYFSQEPLSRDSVLQVVIENAERAVALGRKQMADNDTRFILGSSYGLMSRAYVMKQELWDGYWAARDCRNFLEEVIADDPTYYDAYVGLGVIEYYPGQLTGVQAGLAWLGGMSGDIDKGIESLRKTAEKGSLLKDEAIYILGSIYRFFEIDYLQASNYFGMLHERHPSNQAVATAFKQTNLAQVIEEKGIGWLRENLSAIPDEYEIGTSGVLNGMAYSFMGQQKTDVALALFHANIGLFPDEANPYDSIAECYANLGKKDEAIRYSKLCLEKLSGDPSINDAFRETLQEINEERLRQMGATGV